MGDLHFGMVGFDMTPRFHPQFGAWGTTASLTQLDMPLLGRCIALEQDGRRLIWFGLDLVGETVPGTEAIRDELAATLGLERDQIVWSTSQTHSGGALPGSIISGSAVTDLSQQDSDFVAAERKRFMSCCTDAAREAIERLQPVKIWAGHGFCDSMSYNRRLPMPTGGTKFSRNYREGLQGGKFFDTTIGLIRFEDTHGQTLGAIFNFGCHPATMIEADELSPDWVGTARQHVEEAIGGAPAMFAQGFCGDVNCYHIFGTPEQAKRTGARLGKAAAEAMATLTPVRGEPFDYRAKRIELPCRPMYTRQELERELAVRHDFLEELQIDPRVSWYGGYNLPEQFSSQQKAAAVRLSIDYLEEGLRMLEAGEPVRSTLPLTLGAIRIGDVAAVYSPGENFTATGMRIRTRSPFAHTLICGDTNGLFGYIGDDAEIDRGGYEADSYWKMLFIDGFRLAPAKGAVDRIIEEGIALLGELHQGG